MTGPPIVDRAKLKTMKPEEITAATADGRCDLLLSGVDLQRGDRMTPQQWGTCIDHLDDDAFGAALAAGLLDPILPDGAASASASADQGARGKRAPSTAAAIRAELAGLSSDEIHARTISGQLDALLRGEVA